MVAFKAIDVEIQMVEWRPDKTPETVRRWTQTARAIPIGGGLAVNREVQHTGWKLWAITHIPTGCCVETAFTSSRQAVLWGKAFLAALSPRSLDQLTKPYKRCPPWVKVAKRAAWREAETMTVLRSE